MKFFCPGSDIRRRGMDGDDPHNAGGSFILQWNGGFREPDTVKSFEAVYYAQKRFVAEAFQIDPALGPGVVFRDDEHAPLRFAGVFIRIGDAPAIAHPTHDEAESTHVFGLVQNLVSPGIDRRAGGFVESMQELPAFALIHGIKNIRSQVIRIHDPPLHTVAGACHTAHKLCILIYQ